MGGNVFLLVAVAALAVVPRTARALPDLTPEIYGVELLTDATVDPGDVVEGCAGGTTGRTLLRFGTKVQNVGNDDLLIGNPGCPDCVANPGAPCTNPLFVCSPGLQVSHYRAAARFELLDPSGRTVLVGSKRGYCFNDDECVDGKSPQFTACDYQGLTAGCIDDYEPFLSCQYLDVTDVPSVTSRAFRLRVTIDTDYLLPDADRTNDVTEIAIPGCGDGIVQAGEDCDAGPDGGDPCCDASCHPAAAGTGCRPATGPCDAAESCDGVSPRCPADGALPDGTECGSGTPPCRTRQCRAATCVADVQPETCVIDGACAAAGGASPSDACQVCDPNRSADAWSPDVHPDAQGVRCQLGRLTAAVEGVSCSSRATRMLGAPLRRLQRVVARQIGAPARVRPSPQASIRGAERLSRALARAARRHGCDVGAAAPAADVLVGQLRALAAATGP